MKHLYDLLVIIVLYIIDAYVDYTFSTLHNYWGMVLLQVLSTAKDGF